MKRQARPFIVEVKRKRGVQERGRSIWSDINLSAVTEMVEEAEAPSHRLVDSSPRSTDVKSRHEPQAEQYMADPQEGDNPMHGVPE
ncbi:hypothetical protein [Mesorhizobium sp. GR13]|jgi:hypothetical protein|uniref:hypothetical protein n=1 Tax=Mesorhizobium sp. GR13 TaxID=2562308 RepID=UPI0010BF77CC|nr:hypothetical protein [Mesorhizobium sp. GR13]